MCFKRLPGWAEEVSDQSAEGRHCQLRVLMLVRDATVANLIFERSEPLVDIELQARVFLDPAVVARKR